MAKLLLLPVIAITQLFGAGYDRPYGDPKLSRSVVIAPNGMVATSHTLAAGHFTEADPRTRVRAHPTQGSA
ncbi:MAG TPA: hypothetical protein DGJ56_09255 [Verrucomicrobiales bacterium]|nr:hypothetical protein [Verrucomicrobiales bacterium]